jgi:hypothetical protein
MRVGGLTPLRSLIEPIRVQKQRGTHNARSDDNCACRIADAQWLFRGTARPSRPRRSSRPKGRHGRARSGRPTRGYRPCRSRWASGPRWPGWSPGAQGRQGRSWRSRQIKTPILRKERQDPRLKLDYKDAFDLDWAIGPALPKNAAREATGDRRLDAPAEGRRCVSSPGISWRRPQPGALRSWHRSQRGQATCWLSIGAQKLHAE